MRIRFGLLLALLFAGTAATPVAAHEGHDHGEAGAATPAIAGPPRASARSADFEAVAVLEGTRLTIFLDRYASNEPVVGATIEIESGTLQARAAAIAPGVYAASAPELARPVRHALALAIQAGETSDLLDVVIDAAAAPAVVTGSTVSANVTPLRIGAAVAAAMVALVWLLAGRRRRAGRASAHAAMVPGWLAAGVLIAGMATLPADLSAHGGEDHSHDDQPAKTAVPGAAVFGEAVSARRLPDGSVFMPKAMQYQLGLKHLIAQSGEHPATIEFSAKVVADPNASGRVQPTQGGRIEAGPRGLPVIGQRVTRGQVLAVLRPSSGAIERGGQQALRAELEAQRSIAERRLARLEQLEGSVPRKDLEAAQIELEGLQQRIRAIGGGLAASEPLSAPVSGVVSAVHVLAGQVVDARETVIEIVDPARLAVEALAYEPVLARDLASASAEVAGRSLPLAFVGAGRQLREQAVPLWFSMRSGDAVLAVGQTLKVIARTTRRTAGVALPRSALVRLANGETGVWVHVWAERFVPRRVATRALDGATLVATTGIEAGERVVTDGASLLAQVR